jgi:hypothetical protein
MNADDYIFQYRTPGSIEWQDHHKHNDYLNTTHMRDIPLGKTFLSKFGDYRRVPRDPLLRAMVLAELEAK